ncbi:hypothetical protein F5Y05DRAFT_395370 [Hypoxylon sp. FL0543]|nr:hypothetical protein F5Y05DRAFT_395370 [Hypoxylon sp. FL0543]
MNVSWHTTYETANLWLIAGWNFNSPIQLATNVGQTWYQWDVSTDSTNSSEVYAFRVVNATGTTDEQQNGGFLSAAFWIDGLQTASKPLPATASHISTSASAPATISAAASSPASAQSAESTIESESAGLTDGEKTGVGVGVSIGGLGVIALIIGILLYRRSRNDKTQAVDDGEPDWQVTPHSYDVALDAQSYDECYKPAELESTERGAELGAGQGHRFTPEAYSHDAPGPHVAELPG